MSYTIYLSGEIHTSWRQELMQATTANHLNITFLSPVTDHPASDAAGDHLGEENNPFWRDHKSAKINAMRTQTMIQQCDLAIIRFGQEYKQWNAAFDAGQCAALGKPYITLHDENLIHPLKEVDASAHAWATTPQQVAEILTYIIKQA